MVLWYIFTTVPLILKFHMWLATLLGFGHQSYSLMLAFKFLLHEYLRGECPRSVFFVFFSEHKKIVPNENMQLPREKAPQSASFVRALNFFVVIEIKPRCSVFFFLFFVFLPE